MADKAPVPLAAPPPVHAVLEQRVPEGVEAGLHGEAPLHRAPVRLLDETEKSRQLRILEAPRVALAEDAATKVRHDARLRFIQGRQLPGGRDLVQEAFGRP